MALPLFTDSENFLDHDPTFVFFFFLCYFVFTHFFTLFKEKLSLRTISVKGHLILADLLVPMSMVLFKKLYPRTGSLPLRRFHLRE